MRLGDDVGLTRDDGFRAEDEAEQRDSDQIALHDRGRFKDGSIYLQPPQHAHRAQRGELDKMA